MQGTLRIDTVEGSALAGNPLGDPTRRPLPVYLPPGYEAGTARYPVVYFLHGFTGTALGWTQPSAFTPSVVERMDALISTGGLPPAIGVFIDGWTRLGGTQWDNSDAIGAYRDYVVRDVVAQVDRTLRTVPAAEARAVVGKSSGGYGALVMGRHHPDVFAHLGCHSGDAYFEYCYLPDFPKAAAVLLKTGVAPWFEEMLLRGRQTKLRGEDHSVINVLAMAASYSPREGLPLGLELPFEPDTARLRPEVWARWLERDPVRFIPQAIDRFRALKSVFVDCGTRDEFHMRWGARMVVEALRRGGIDPVHEEFEDGHMGINYRFERSLTYLLPRLARSA